MFRLSRLLKMSGGNNGSEPVVARPPSTFSRRRRGLPAPIIIWNLTRACNLTCLHCYASAGSGQFEGDLSHEDALRVIDDIAAAGVKMVILSGGEPMLRSDLLSLATRIKERGMNVSLSTNGTLINEENSNLISDAGFSYVGISLDGAREIHDKFRGLKGAFDKSLNGLARLNKLGLKTGVRFTLTQFNIDDLPEIVGLVEETGSDKLYLSHLVYSGRGNDNKSEDISHEVTRSTMEYVFAKASEYIDQNNGIEVVTGNNDADGAFLYLWLKERNPSQAEALLEKLERSGGNSAGIGVANIDALGNVHPDPLIQYVNMGNVLDRAFADIWYECDDDSVVALRNRPRKISGRCGECQWIKACGGSNRERAFRLTGDFWASDPSCYLTDKEIGIEIACSPSSACR